MGSKNSTEIMTRLVEGMPIPEQRQVFIMVWMVRRKKTFREIARKHRISAWYLSGAVAGRFPWSKKHIAALEAELDVDLSEFITRIEMSKRKA